MNRLVYSLLVTMLLLSPTAFAQGSGASKSQAGGLPALAEEVAELRALINALQEQIGEQEEDPYVGTYAVTLIETGLFGCGIGTPPPQYSPPYMVRQAVSSVLQRSASFEAEADGSTLFLPVYELSSQELRLSGTPESEIRIEGGVALLINGDGSISYEYADEEDGETLSFTGQISNDGSMFSILARGVDPEGNCTLDYTISLTGVKK